MFSLSELQVEGREDDANPEDEVEDALCSWWRGVREGLGVIHVISIESGRREIEWGKGKSRE